MTVSELISALIAHNCADLPVRVSGTYPDTSPIMEIRGMRWVEDEKLDYLLIELE